MEKLETTMRSTTKFFDNLPNDIIAIYSTICEIPKDKNGKINIDLLVDNDKRNKKPDGTGFIVVHDNKAYLITCSHLIENKNKSGNQIYYYCIGYYPGNEFILKYENFQIFENYDLAISLLKGDDIHGISSESLLTDIKELEESTILFDICYIMGYPFGLANKVNGRYKPILRLGKLISPIIEDWKQDSHEYEDQFIAQIPCYPGDSGAPFVLFRDFQHRRSNIMSGDLHLETKVDCKIVGMHLGSIDIDNEEDDNKDLLTETSIQRFLRSNIIYTIIQNFKD